MSETFLNNAQLTGLTKDARRTEILRAKGMAELDTRLTAAEAEIAALEALTTPTAWTGVTFQNSWVNYAASTPVQYRKVGDNVQIRGRLKSGTLGATAFVLPVGFRPAYVHNQIIMGATRTEPVAVAITDAGVVTFAAASNAEINLGTIWFSVTA